jgi:hypothetical protein
MLPQPDSDINVQLDKADLFDFIDSRKCHNPGGLVRGCGFKTEWGPPV